MTDIKPSDITPEHIYLSRREFMRGLGALAGGSLLLAACADGTAPTSPPTQGALPQATLDDQEPLKPSANASSDELGDPLSTFEAVTNFNNFYEFSQDKREVASLSQGFVTSPWSVQVGGLVGNPKTFDLDDLRGRFPQEERVYRLRCVEGWSMVIPWIGFPLASLLKEVDPLPEATFVRFESLHDPEQMPGQKFGWFPWPYVEGLRMDEAMNELATLATGLYGNHLLPQNGAPVRLVVPWKYGFKSLKAIVKIDLVAEQPTSLWMESAPREYGFYANVNPEVPHPRWSQSTERRIGELGRRPTLPFNGYQEQVAHLYEGMDLTVNY